MRPKITFWSRLIIELAEAGRCCFPSTKRCGSNGAKEGKDEGKNKE